jgi:hypothetical protein
MADLQSESGFENGQYCMSSKNGLILLHMIFASDCQNLVEQHSRCGQMWLVVTEAKFFKCFEHVRGKIYCEKPVDGKNEDLMFSDPNVV